jgi:hypothetical protein
MRQQRRTEKAARGLKCPHGTRELKRYCENNGWVVIRNTDHWHYEKVLANGDVLKAKVSHALHKEIPAHIWSKILKNQLRITEEQFYKHRK